jgi:peptidoglycan biosynthesis protein MviN/MurJ (putative lipid II flippase)
MLVNLGLAVVLYRVLSAGGLALANGVAVTVEVLILLAVAHRRMAGVEAGAIGRTLWRTLFAAGMMGLAVLAFTSFWPSLSPLLGAAAGGVLGLIVYLLAGFWLGVEEIRLIPRLASHL